MDFLEAWTDGATRVSNPGESAAAVVIPGLPGRVTLGKYVGWRTNNEAEYEGLVMALEYTLRSTEHKRLRVYTDSQLVCNQMNGLWRVHDDKPYYKVWRKAFQLSVELDEFEIKWLRGHCGDHNNEAADAECNRILDEYQQGRGND